MLFYCKTWLRARIEPTSSLTEDERQIVDKGMFNSEYNHPQLLLNRTNGCARTAIPIQPYTVRFTLVLLAKRIAATVNKLPIIVAGITPVEKGPGMKRPNRPIQACNMCLIRAIGPPLQQRSLPA